MDEPTGGTTGVEQYRPVEVGALNYIVWGLTRLLRLALIGVSVLVIIAYGFIMKDSSDSKRLTPIGKTFNIISGMGFIFVMFLILVIQFEVEFFMRHLRFFDYWPVRSAMQFFMGAQIIISKESFKIEGLGGYTFQDTVLSFTGWILTIGSVLLTLLSFTGARRYDHLGTGPKDMSVDTGVGNKGSKKAGVAVAAAPGSAAPLIDEAVVSGAPRGGGDADGFGGGGGAYAGGDAQYPYAKPTSEVQEVYIPPPAPAQAAPGGGDPWAKPQVASATQDPFGSGRSGGGPALQDDIQRRRQAEDDDLEALYARAAAKPAPKAAAAAPDMPDDPFACAN